MDLTYFNRARAAFAKAVNLDEVKEIRDKAEALRIYASQAGEAAAEMERRCAEIRLRAERRIRELLAGAVRPGLPGRLSGAAVDPAIRSPDSGNRDNLTPEITAIASSHRSGSAASYPDRPLPPQTKGPGVVSVLAAGLVVTVLTPPGLSDAQPPPECGVLRGRNNTDLTSKDV